MRIANRIPISTPSSEPRSIARSVAFGDRVRDLRRERGRSQEHLAHEAALDRTYVSGIERGTRNVGLDNIHKLADALHVDASALFKA